MSEINVCTGSKLLKRWYSLNKAQVDEQIAERLAKEAEALRLQQEELRLALNFTIAPFYRAEHIFNQ